MRSWDAHSALRRWPADTISATHVFPASLIYSRSFLEYVKKANEAGKGVFASRCAAARRRSA